MTPKRSEYVVGVDGGGTASRAIAVATDGEVLAEISGGPLNFYTTSPSRFRESVRDVLTRIATVAGPGTLLHVVIGTAALFDQPSDQEKAVATEGLPEQTRENLTLTGDAVVAAHGATEGKPGVLVIAGTGSVAIAIGHDGRHAFQGGFGPLIGGDPGSAFWMASQAVLAASRGALPDSRPTALAESICAHFRVRNLTSLIPILYQDGFACGKLAALSEFLAVGDSEHASDWPRIEEEAGSQLAHLAEPLCRFVGVRDASVYAAGAVLTKNSRVRKSLEQHLSKMLRREVVVVKPALDAPAGAALMAFDRIRHEITPAILQGLRTSRP